MAAKNTDRLYRKGLYLEYFNVGYNILEAVASIIFGSIAGSIALIGFGLDSIVESLSGLVLIWRLRQHGKISEELEEKIGPLLTETTDKEVSQRFKKWIN